MKNLKKYLLAIILIITFISIHYLVKSKCEDKKDTYKSVNGEVIYYSTAKEDSSCHIIEIKIPEADTETFTDLGYDYFKDKNHVFKLTFKGYEILENVDPQTYEVLDISYKKDKNYVYWYDEVIQDADPKTFEVLYKNAEAKDKNYFYQYGQKIIGANEDTYKFLNYYYAFFDGVIYFTGKPLVSSPEDYEILSDDYLRVGSEIWYDDEKINGVDVDSFEVLSNDVYSRDKNHTYYMGEVSAK